MHVEPLSDLEKITEDIFRNTQWRRELVGRLQDNDLLEPLEPIMAPKGPYYMDPEDMKIKVPMGVRTETQWVHSHREPRNRCRLWFFVWAPCYKILPSPCLSCWKVKVTLEKFTQLIRMYELQKDLGHPGKCGIETRDFVGAHYGAYFYNRSYEEGRECLEKVRKAVAERISPDVDVILKRGCTEYELPQPFGFGFGPSNKWQVSEYQLEKEERLNALFHRSTHSWEEPRVVTIRTMRHWATFAHSRADFSYLHFNDGSFLYPKVVDYSNDDVKTKDPVLRRQDNDTETEYGTEKLPPG